MKAENALLGNVKLSYKLMIGYSILIFLILLTAWAGWSGIRLLGDRTERSQDIAHINDLAQKVNISMQLYNLSYDAEHAANWIRSIDELSIKLTAASNYFTSPKNMSYIDQAIQSTVNYRAKADEAIKFITTREKIRLLFPQNAAVITSLLNTELSRIDVASNQSTQKLKLDELLRLMLIMRFEVRGYIYNFSHEAEIPARNAIMGFANYAKSNNGLYASVETARELDRVMEKYRSDFEEFIVAQDMALKNQQQALRELDKLLSVTADMTAFQGILRVEDIKSAQNLMVSLVLIAIISGIISGYLTSKSIVTPINQVIELVDKISAGDLTHNQLISRKDELGVIQHHMYSMASNLRSVIVGFSDTATQISDQALALASVSQQTSDGAHNQKIETDQVAAAMHEMVATVTDVASNAERAAEVSTRAAEAGRSSKTEVISAVAQIEALASEVRKSRNAMAGLKNDAGKIGRVLEVIEAVAQQTNLLALNAAIEAARAGDAGRGFAVVADEVRSLAMRTQQSTEEIVQLIDALHQATERVESTLDVSWNLAENSVGLTKNVGDSLGAMSESITSIESMNQQIAVAAEQQSMVAEDISRNIINVRDISEKTALGSDLTAGSSTELARLSGHLRTLIDRFKI
ncbi:hypothetical protein AO073_15670 [Pseudomonas syringae ICMP 11293]|nr:methyl-accepting chemotaxis protein [Pseudomonas syringae]KTB95279.1 hypothetical protein AO073_15670 [Pseudomonas syringae ICMP 11293]